MNYQNQMRPSVTILGILIMLTFFILTADAAFDVRIIYFKPTDAGDIDVDRHNVILKDIQKYYQSEMTRHGYVDYTFPLELDNLGSLVVHIVNGRHVSAHYVRGDWIYDSYIHAIKPELPFEFNNDRNIASRDDVILIIFGGEVKEANWVHGMGFRWLLGRWGGIAAVKERSKNHYLALIAHELGHAFGLDPGHNNVRESLNGRLLAFGKTTKDWGNKMRLLKFEADVLKSRPIFRKITLQEEKPEEPQPNKNPDLVEDKKEEGENPQAIHVKPNSLKLTTTWAKLKGG